MPIEEEFNPSANNPFVSGHDGFDDELSRRARVVVTPDIHVDAPQNNDTKWNRLTPSEKRRLLGVGAGLTAVAVAGIVGAPEIADQLNGPEYSAETTTYTVQPGDGWWDITEAIDGYETVDRKELIAHVQADPANIDILTNGNLQPGQSITIPLSVEK